MRLQLVGSIGWAILLGAVGACGGDKVTPNCGDAGITQTCQCEDENSGIQRCQADGTLSECDCTQPGGGGKGGVGGTGGSSASGGTGGVGGEDEDGGGGLGGTGGVGGGTTDAGPMMDGAVGPPPPPPKDGNQLAVCKDGNDCNMGLDCYTEGGGQDFCTKLCEREADCDGVGGSDHFSCNADGLCEVQCDPDNAASCPEGLVCLRGDPPLLPLQDPEYRCKYSRNAGMGDGAAFSVCDNDRECDEGLECVSPSANSSVGYCSHDCMNNADCTEQPSSGSIMASCEMSFPLGGSSCGLDCMGAMNDCPDGMVCGFGSRCAYPD